MEKITPTEHAILRLKNGVPVTHILQDTQSPSMGDYLYGFLCKTDRSMEAISGLAGLNKSTIYRILNGEVSPQRNVLLRLARTLEMDLSETQKLLKIGKVASLSGSDPRDIIIMDGIMRSRDIVDICNRLMRSGYSDLYSKK